MNPTDHQREQAGLDQPNEEAALDAPPAPTRGRSARRPTAPPGPATGTPPTDAAYAQAVQQIRGQLNPHEPTAMQTIDQVVRQVGLTIAIWAVGLAQQAQQRQGGEHRLTMLEQWIVTCRQIAR